MASIYHDIPFLQNVQLTNLVRNMPLQNDLRALREIMPERPNATRKTEWETVLGGRNIAPIVAMDTATPLVRHPGVQRHAAEAVDVREKFFLDEGTLLFLRQPGERESRQGRQIVGDQLARMRNDVESRQEKMIWDVLLEGKIEENQDIDGEKVLLSYDYGVPSSQFKTASPLWSNVDDADPRDDFKLARTQVREANGRRVRVVWMNTNTHDALDRLVALRTDFRNQESAPDDLVKREHITDIIHNIRILNYDEGYKEDVNWEGEFKYYLPDGKIIFMVTTNGIDAGERFADVSVAPSRLADGSTVDGLFAETWTAPDPTRDYVRVGKVMIPRLFHADWFVTYTVL